MVMLRVEPEEPVARIQLLALKYIMPVAAAVLEQVPEEEAVLTGEVMEAAPSAEDLLVQLIVAEEEELAGVEPPEVLG